MTAFGDIQIPLALCQIYKNLFYPDRLDVLNHLCGKNIKICSYPLNCPFPVHCGMSNTKLNKASYILSRRDNSEADAFKHHSLYSLFHEICWMHNS